MLPTRLLVVASPSGGSARVVPRYLGARDEVWVRALLDVFDAFVGRTAGEREAELPGRVRALGLAHGVTTRTADGVSHVLMRRFRAVLDDVVDCPRVRAITFEEAGRDDRFDRDAALSRAAARLGLSVEATVRAVFADRPARRRIAAPDKPLAPAEVVDLYNLALVQSLLRNSEGVCVHVREHVRAVVRFAKLTGLLCTYTPTEDGTRLHVSGPLSILRHTTKYGFALASFFPAVVATPGYELEARCVLDGEPVLVHIDAAARIARTHALPKDADSAIERALARDLRRLGCAWTLLRESEALATERGTVYPDFTLRHASGFGVLIEVVGFYTPEYLRSKLAALRSIAPRPLLVCIDDSLACADGELPGVVLRFKRRIDAQALVTAAEQLRSSA